jgi:putative FmdB family regulatory protein
MPIYEYRCEDCDSSFETLVQAGQHDEPQCPSCMGVKIVREMSVFASRGGNGDAKPDQSGAAMMRGGGGCCGGSCGCH